MRRAVVTLAIVIAGLQVVVSSTLGLVGIVVGMQSATDAVTQLIAESAAQLPPEPTDDDGPATSTDPDLGELLVYQVQDGELSPAPPAGSLTETVWETFVRVVTPEVASETFSMFEVGDNNRADLMAYVYLSNHRPETWNIGVNLAESADLGILVPTLVHEYAHVLSLRAEQRDPDSDGQCPALEVSEGCLLADSALQRFHVEFWEGYSDAPGDDNDDVEIADGFYAAHSDDFVSAYAATNVVEDFAESFMTFVLEDRPRSSDSGIVAQKLEFFWDVDEFVEIRAHVRSEFADELGLTP